MVLASVAESHDDPSINRNCFQITLSEICWFRRPRKFKKKNCENFTTILITYEKLSIIVFKSEEENLKNAYYLLHTLYEYM